MRMCKTIKRWPAFWCFAVTNEKKLIGLDPWDLLPINMALDFARPLTISTGHISDPNFPFKHWFRKVGPSEIRTEC